MCVWWGLLGSRMGQVERERENEAAGPLNDNGERDLQAGLQHHCRKRQVCLCGLCVCVCVCVGVCYIHVCVCVRVCRSRSSSLPAFCPSLSLVYLSSFLASSLYSSPAIHPILPSQALSLRVSWEQTSTSSHPPHPIRTLQPSLPTDSTHHSPWHPSFSPSWTGCVACSSRYALSPLFLASFTHLNAVSSRSLSSRYSLLLLFFHFLPPSSTLECSLKRHISSTTAWRTLLT